MADEVPVSLEEQIAEVERELRLRDRVYPRWVEGKKMTPPAAAKHMSRMRAVRETLVEVQAMRTSKREG